MKFNRRILARRLGRLLGGLVRTPTRGEIYDAPIDPAFDHQIKKHVRRDAIAAAQYAGWSDARRAMQDDVKAGRDSLSESTSHYGLHG